MLGQKPAAKRNFARALCFVARALPVWVRFPPITYPILEGPAGSTEPAPGANRSASDIRKRWPPAALQAPKSGHPELRIRTSRDH